VSNGEKSAFCTLGREKLTKMAILGRFWPFLADFSHIPKLPIFWNF
jgi:hypothetical protein